MELTKDVDKVEAIIIPKVGIVLPEFIDVDNVLISEGVLYVRKKKQVRYAVPMTNIDYVYMPEVEKK